MCQLTLFGTSCRLYVAAASPPSSTPRSRDPATPASFPASPVPRRRPSRTAKEMILTKMMKGGSEGEERSVKIVQIKLQLQNTFQHFRTKVNTSVKSIFSEEVSPRRTLAGPPSSSDESLPSSWISDVCLLLDIFFLLSFFPRDSTDIPTPTPTVQRVEEEEVLLFEVASHRWQHFKS